MSVASATTLKDFFNPPRRDEMRIILALRSFQRWIHFRLFFATERIGKKRNWPADRPAQPAGDSGRLDAFLATRPQERSASFICLQRERLNRPRLGLKSVSGSDLWQWQLKKEIREVWQSGSLPTSRRAPPLKKQQEIDHLDTQP